MDSFVKHLRDGRALGGESSSSSCPLCVVFDDLSTTGSAAVMRHLSNGLSSAISSEKAQPRELILVSFEGGLKVEGGHVRFVDARMVGLSGWREEEQTLEDLQASISRTAHQSEVPVGIIFDSLSPLLTFHQPNAVLSFLLSISRISNVSCILAALHNDQHPPKLVASIEHLCSCCVFLRPLDPFQLEVAKKHLTVPPHGCISFRFKRRTGRVRADNLLYIALTSGSISFSPPPPAMAAVTAESLLNLSLTSSKRDLPPHSSLQQGPLPQPPATAPAAAPPQVGSSMRLGLTDEEKRAKEQVKMPFQHQGEGKALYGTGDFRDYLPKAAGGVSSKQQHQIDHRADEDEGGGEVSRLGHINYVRDSESEGYSDEDPDDDLDI
jgi:hypothetical protein